MRIVVCWPKFGPYHLARLDAVAAAGEGIELVGLETDPTDTTYSWRDSNGMQQHQWQRTWTDRAGLRATLSRLNPELVFVNGWGFAKSRQVLAWAAANKTPVCLFSDSLEPKSTRPVLTSVKQRLVRLADAALVAGPDHSAYLAQLGMPSDRVVMGYDVVDNAYFARSACRARAQSQELKSQLGLPAKFFLAPARLIAKKNLPRLLQSFQHYRSKAAREPTLNNPPWHLVLLGDGEQRFELEWLCNQLAIARFVQFAGFQQYDQLPLYYGLADAVILASVDEPWGLVVNEAMACELPVLVSSQCGCASSLVRHGENGFLLDPDNVYDMAAAMWRLAAASDDQRASMGRASAQIISEWSLGRFVCGFFAAAEIATIRPRKKSAMDRLVAQMLSREQAPTRGSALPQT